MALVIAVFFALRPGLAIADCPSEEVVLASLNDAGRHYVMRNFDLARVTLEPLLAEGEDCIDQSEILIEIHLLLGMSLFELGEEEAASEHFLALLRIEPDYTLDPSVTTLTIERFFGSVREEHREELDEIRALRGQDTEAVEVQNIWVVAEDSVNHYWINFLPFGAGSFQNGDTDWGIFFAVMQGLGLSMNLTGVVMVEVIRGDTYTFTAEEAEQARSWQMVQFAGLGVFAIFYVWGVVDGAMNFRERDRVYLPPSREPPPDLEREEEEAHLEWSILPFAGPTGGGLQLGVRY